MDEYCRKGLEKLVFERHRKFGALGRPQKRRFAKKLIGLIDVDNYLPSIVGYTADFYFPVDNEVDAG